MTNRESLRHDFASYAIGLACALLLTGAAFAVVAWHLAAPGTALAIVFGLGLAQVIAHFRFFLHIDLQRSAREDLQLILFSTLITLLMVGGTLVILFNLRSRMM
jgi:cytochrome o ubiquinol oxidase operon protein cyoD